MQVRVKAVLDSMVIEIVKGSAPPDFTDYKLEPGVLPLAEEASLSFDVFIPAFWQGPNTDFLKDNPNALNERGLIDANECLQSTAYPEIFGVGVSTVPLEGHPVSLRVKAQGTTAAKNAIRLVTAKPVRRHVDTEMKAAPRPPTLKVGHGSGAYMFWDLGCSDPPFICCCQCVGGGFPFCPPPCCWPCAPGCSTVCGKCCGPAGGEGAAIFMLSFLLPMFPARSGMKGTGNLPPEAEAMVDR